MVGVERATRGEITPCDQFESARIHNPVPGAKPATKMKALDNQLGRQACPDVARHRHASIDIVRYCHASPEVARYCHTS